MLQKGIQSIECFLSEPDWPRSLREHVCIQTVMEFVVLDTSSGNRPVSLLSSLIPQHFSLSFSSLQWVALMLVVSSWRIPCGVTGAFCTELQLSMPLIQRHTPFEWAGSLCYKVWTGNLAGFYFGILDLT